MCGVVVRSVALGHSGSVAVGFPIITRRSRSIAVGQSLRVSYCSDWSLC